MNVHSGLGQLPGHVGPHIIETNYNLTSAEHNSGRYSWAVGGKDGHKKSICSEGCRHSELLN